MGQKEAEEYLSKPDKDLDEIYGTPAPISPAPDYERSLFRLIFEKPAGHASLEMKPGESIAASQNLPASPKSPKSIG